LLVVFEEWGGDPNGIFLVRREIDSVCADIYEWQPTLMNWQMQASGKVDKPLRPKAHLWCGPGQKISSIKFASFGTPEGVCGSFREGSCHAHKSYDAFQRVYYDLALLMQSIFAVGKLISLEAFIEFEKKASQLLSSNSNASFY
jgi:hypothetical protein